MKFEKITDTQIKIILDIKDMELHNITNKSIIATSTFPQKLLQTMLKTAEKEVGFKADASKLLVEATMPNNTECIFIITKLTTKTISSLDNSFVFKFDIPKVHPRTPVTNHYIRTHSFIIRMTGKFIRTDFFFFPPP